MCVTMFCVTGFVSVTMLVRNGVACAELPVMTLYLTVLCVTELSPVCLCGCACVRVRVRVCMILCDFVCVCLFVCGGNAVCGNAVCAWQG